MLSLHDVSGSFIASQVTKREHLTEDSMRYKHFYFLILIALAMSVRPSSRAQEKPGEPSKLGIEIPTAAPASSFRAEFLKEIAYYENRYTKLAEAMPAEKYAWHSAEALTGSAKFSRKLSQ